MRLVVQNGYGGHRNANAERSAVEFIVLSWRRQAVGQLDSDGERTGLPRAGLEENKSEESGIIWALGGLTGLALI